MQYIIRCIWPHNQWNLRSDCIKTDRGWEHYFGNVGSPTIYYDLNTAYMTIDYHHGATCSYEVEECS